VCLTKRNDAPFGIGMGILPLEKRTQGCTNDTPSITTPMAACAAWCGKLLQTFRQAGFGSFSTCRNILSVLLFRALLCLFLFQFPGPLFGNFTTPHGTHHRASIFLEDRPTILNCLKKLVQALRNNFFPISLRLVTVSRSALVELRLLR
jgi:hypothetical protein